jgi:hypothetical protein
MADLKEQRIIKSYFILEKEFLRLAKCVKKNKQTSEWYVCFKVARLKLKTLYAERDGC